MNDKVGDRQQPIAPNSKGTQYQSGTNGVGASNRPETNGTGAAEYCGGSSGSGNGAVGETKDSEQLSVWQHILEDIDCVFDRDPAARNRWEVVFTYPGFHALLMYRVAHWMCRHRWRFLARWVSFVARGLTLIEIHPSAKIGRRFFIDHGAGVVIGETAEIGNDVTLYHGVTLGGTSWDQGKRHPTLEDGVVVGTGAKVLGPIVVGKGARVGANAVVVKDVEPGMSVVGIPGRVVLPIHCRRITEHGIDLDHHLMPDPVGKALSSLIERIDSLESEVNLLKSERQELLAKLDEHSDPVEAESAGTEDQ